MFFSFGPAECLIMAMIIAGVYAGKKYNGRGVLGGTLVGTSLIVLVAMGLNIDSRESLVFGILAAIFFGGLSSALFSVIVVGIWRGYQIVAAEMNRWGMHRHFLKGLLVVLLILFWFASSWRWAHQRRDFLQLPIISEKTFAADRMTRAPGLLPLFGERGYQDIYLGGEEWQYDEASMLFPEAEIHPE